MIPCWWLLLGGGLRSNSKHTKNQSNRILWEKMHPCSLTWNRKINLWKRRFLSSYGGHNLQKHFNLNSNSCKNLDASLSPSHHWKVKPSIPANMSGMSLAFCGNVEGRLPSTLPARAALTPIVRGWPSLALASSHALIWYATAVASSFVSWAPAPDVDTNPSTIFDCTFDPKAPFLPLAFSESSTLRTLSFFGSDSVGGAGVAT